MNNGENGFAKRHREAFEAWQVKADEVCQHWMSHPAFLRAGRVALDASLDLSSAYRRMGQALGFETAFMETAARDFSSGKPWRRAAMSCGSSRLAPQVAATPCEVIYRGNKLRLLRYRGTSPRLHQIPILILGSLVNKYYILDLLPGRSYVEYLVHQGFDVYQVDWGEPDDADAKLSLVDYVNGYVPNLISSVLRHSRARKVSLLGYSMSGVLALIRAALDKERVRNLVLLATPVDFHKAGVLAAWTNKEYFDVDRFVGTLGNVPAEMIQWSFSRVEASEQCHQSYQSVAACKRQGRSDGPPGVGTMAGGERADFRRVLSRVRQEFLSRESAGAKRTHHRWQSSAVVGRHLCGAQRDRNA